MWEQLTLGYSLSAEKQRHAKARKAKYKALLEFEHLQERKRALGEACTASFTFGCHQQYQGKPRHHSISQRVLSPPNICNRCTAVWIPKTLVARPELSSRSREHCWYGLILSIIKDRRLQRTSTVFSFRSQAAHNITAQWSFAGIPMMTVISD